MPNLVILPSLSYRKLYPINVSHRHFPTQKLTECDEFSFIVPARLTGLEWKYDFDKSISGTAKLS